MQLLCGGMGCVAVERAVDERALRRHLATRRVDALGQDIQVPHGMLGRPK